MDWLFFPALPRKKKSLFLYKLFKDLSVHKLSTGIKFANLCKNGFIYHLHRLFIMNAAIDQSESRISKRRVLITNEMWLIKHNLISEYSHILHFSWVKRMALSHTSCRQLRPKTCTLWWMWKIFMAHSMCLKMVPWTRLAPAPPSPEQPLHGVPLYASIPYTLFNW